MNVRLLRRIQKHILAEPRRFEMNTWLSTGFARKPEDRPPCGTVGCIAGWTVKLSDDGKRGIIPERAKELLNLSQDEAARLFQSRTAYCYSWPRGAKYRWPQRFLTRLRAAKSLRTKAKIAAERIDHFIKTKGAE